MPLLGRTGISPSLFVTVWNVMAIYNKRIHKKWLSIQKQTIRKVNQKQQNDKFSEDSLPILDRSDMDWEGQNISQK